MSSQSLARSGVLAAGTWLVDHVKVIDKWPLQDGLANILQQSVGNGGSPYNVLKDLAKLGASFPLAGVGLIADDANGRTVLADCQAHNIDTSQLHTTKTAATGYTDVMVERGTGRRTLFHQAGANAQLAPEHFDFTSTTAKNFHLGYLLLLNTLDQLDLGGKPRAVDVLRRAGKAGLQTSLDCVSIKSDRFRATILPVLPIIDVLFVNDYEAEQLTGISIGRGAALHRKAVEQAARALIEVGVKIWVLIHFPEGVCAYSAINGFLWQSSVCVPQELIQSAAGAGDALAAGVLYGLHAEWEMARCLELGVCAAAASLSDLTCSNSVQPAIDCLSLGRQLGFRTLPR